MKSTRNVIHYQGRTSSYLLIGLLLIFLSGWLCPTTSAATIGAENAHKAVGKWIAENPRPMGSGVGGQVDTIETFSDANNQPVYHVVYLRPSGFVIVPADDEVEPIICFVSEGSYDPSGRNPLGALVSGDLPARVDAVRKVQMKMLSAQAAGSLTEKETAVRKSAQDASGKWAKLLSTAKTSTESLKTIAGVSDIRVAPLLQSKWGQTTVCGNACYNYYTPPYGPNDFSNYPCGCVATAMVQYMRFRQFPTLGVGTASFTVLVNSNPQTLNLRGGDGSGGRYNWGLMTLVPGCSITLAQRQAIGALAYDAGVAALMDYESIANGGSGAYISDAADALVGTFDYSNAIFGYNSENNIGAALNDMVNPNLDSSNPVILGISGYDDIGSPIGHAIVADGYGYQGSTLYHHLNLGWDGSDDAWYNLPNISSSPSFNIVDSTIYNIYTSGTGEIISGRITVSGTSTPIAGATVTAKRTGGGTYQATTNAKGIYAIAKVPSSSTYAMSVAKSGYSFNTKTATSGNSQSSNDVSGNSWAVDFTGIVATGLTPVASNLNVSAEMLVPTTITLQGFDNGLPDPPAALTYIITSMPRHGTLADPSAGAITSVPYSLVSYGKDVTYTSTSQYFTGPDTFQFKVNDGSTSPADGNSAVASVRVTVLTPLPHVVYETGFDTGQPAGWLIANGGTGIPSDGNTWRFDNPGYWTSAYWTGTFAIVDSDYAGVGVKMDEQLITQTIDCTNLTGVKLRFKQDFKHYGAEIGDVDVRVNGGTWRNVKKYHGADFAGLVELALSSFGADGSSSVQIRWHYYNANYDWYWGIDDVQIIASDVVPAISVDKCTVTAGNKPNSDKISFSGLMNPAAQDFNGVNFIDFIISSDDINAPCDQNFPVNTKTLKNGRYSYSGTSGTVRKSLTYDLKTHKFSFAASNVDLSGLGCPLTIRFVLGDYNSVTDADEKIVNGPTVPIPMLLMVGVKDALRVDKCTVKQNKKLNTDQLTVSGAFAVKNTDPNVADRAREGLAIALYTQQFTIPANMLKAARGIFSCSNAKITDPNATVAATFNFNLYSFTLTIKDANIPAISGDVDFGAAFADYNQVQKVTLP
jgi:hypothetical protein